jgi:hypothetical protein
LRDRVREIRPDYLLPQGYGRTIYEPGELAQWDLWWPEVDIGLPREIRTRFPCERQAAIGFRDVMYSS